MTITLASLRDGVRDMFQNLGPNTITDEALDQYASAGLWRLSEDRARETEYQLAATGSRFDLAALITDWVPEFSVVRQIWQPYPTVSLDNSAPIPDKDWRVQAIGTAQYLFVSGGISSSGALIVYTTPWELEGLAGATVTTVPVVLEEALKNIVASKTAMGMAAKMAGSNDKSMPADFVNMGSSKSDQYRRVAREYEKDYLAGLKLAYDRPKGVAVVRSMTTEDSMGQPFLTHRSGGSRW